jgi:glycosyltransferase involved in cell wall biosynthesis
MMTPVSCYIRTLNEAHNIERCIRSAQQVADEVVVVDSGSSDDTVRIAESLGARVLLNAWPGNGFQKRFAEDQCRHDWLLDLDADEVVTKALADEIRRTVDAAGQSAGIFSIPLITVSPLGQRFFHSAVARRNKLYNRRVVRMPADRAWDQFQLPDGHRAVPLRATLEHWSYSSLEQLVAKFNRSSSARAANTLLPALWKIRLRILFGYPFYFFQFYISRAWFRAGWEGLCIALIAAFGRLLRDIKRHERALAERSKR